MSARPEIFELAAVTKGIHRLPESFVKIGRQLAVLRKLAQGRLFQDRMIVGKIFENVIYVPYCVDLDGEIMKVYDPAIHRRVSDTGERSSCAASNRAKC